ncbi:MAG: dihydrofolate reductase [Ignavibacteriales bacterium]|nr:dihydrofolate reductase [Ignavibacteriales bacterium]
MVTSKNRFENRVHIVITHDKNFDPKHEGVKVFNTLKEGFDYVETLNKDRMFIIGGGDVYKQVLQEGLVDEMIISWMDFDAEGEVSFPRFDKSEWEL